MTAPAVLIRALEGSHIPNRPVLNDEERAAQLAVLAESGIRPPLERDERMGA